MTIAFTTQTFDGNPLDREIADAVRQTAGVLDGLGHGLTEESPRFSWPAFIHATHVIWSAGMAYTCDVLGERLGRTPSAENLMRTSWATYRYGKSVTAHQYLAALDEYNAVRRQMGGFFERYDFLLTPTSTQLALPHAVHHQDKDCSAEEWTHHIFQPESFTPRFQRDGAARDFAAAVRIPQRLPDRHPTHWTFRRRRHGDSPFLGAGNGVAVA